MFKVLFNSPFSLRLNCGFGQPSRSASGQNDFFHCFFPSLDLIVFAQCGFLTSWPFIFLVRHFFINTAMKKFCTNIIYAILVHSER